MPAALDRHALYYPYIHVRDVNWLKATLLCFPQVRRIMPPGFSVNDSTEVRAFRHVLGVDGEPLLAEEETDFGSWKSPVRLAQERLIAILQQNEERVCQAYSLLPDRPAGYSVHTGKMMYELREYLLSKSLARPGGAPNDHHTEKSGWVAVNTALGEAIMSVIAIAIARNKGLDIVTSSNALHHSLAVLDEDEVFSHLLGATIERKEISAVELADELAELVLTSYFNVGQLSAEQIARLIREGKDLRAFKSALVPIAESIPDIIDPLEKRKRLRQKAAEVMNEWVKYKKSLPKFALDALVDTSDLKFPDLASAILVGGTGLALASGSGLAIGILVWKGLGIWRKLKEREANPFNYLTRVEKSGVSIIFPPLA